MSTATTSEYPKVRWDLSALFSSIEDPRIEATVRECKERAESFASTYRGKIDCDDITAQALYDAIRTIEGINNELHKVLSYAELVYSTNTGDAKAAAFMQKMMEEASEIQVRLLFFELELQAMDEAVAQRLITDDTLAKYRHFIKKARTFSPYRLSEKEEAILERTANTGIRAWVRLHDELTSNHVFRLRRPGAEEEERINLQEALDSLRSPDRSLRQAAADCITEGLLDLRRPLCFAFNTILLDKKIEDELRGYSYPEQSRNLSNELDREIVDLVIGKCVERYGLVERFYSVKRELMGLPELTHIDRYAPLFDTKEVIEWNKGKDIVLDSFGRFSPKLRDAAAKFFDNNWIDAEPRMGKTGGAFCSGNTPDTHPVVLMSYMNKMDDVMTLAHELGHGVHDVFASKQTLFNYHPTLPMAELASTFGEMLVFDSLVERADDRDRLALYAEKIEGVFATVFRQAAMFRFEKECHIKRREEGELAPEEIDEAWQRNIQEMFGSALRLGDQHACWWSYVGHFYFAPFYVYAYSLGELLVLSLYQMAKQDTAGFADRYIDLLSLGGSVTPQEQMDLVGVNLLDGEFWDGGLDALRGMVDAFERLAGAR